MADTLPVPIDKPLSRAYLREFSGWSTAYPPGASEPTSLSVMHNCSLTGEGDLSIRPGLRRVLNTPNPGPIVGDIEHFYTTDGRKAILYAIRDGGYVRFRTAVYNATTKVYDRDLTMTSRFPGFTDAGTQLSNSCTYVRYVQIDNKILALPNSSEPFRLFLVGASPSAKTIQSIDRPAWNGADKPGIYVPSQAWIDLSTKTLPPTAVTLTTSTLISTTAANNVFNFGYFYTFNNEIGETAPSQIALIKCQRRWTAWNADPNDDNKSPDQIVTVIPAAAFSAAVAAGAVSWNLYMVTWSDQDSVPPEGVLLKTTSLRNADGSAKSREAAGWAAHTPMLQGTDASMPLPRGDVRDNFTTPKKAANGLVAGDRLVLVYDQENEARITWTSNRQGDYLNFSPSKGGGFKTLTSGNLYMPIAVKLWQNPQSVDTITILCAGLDGQGTAFYMNANTTITTQSQSQVVVGFEETTATNGTCSPYGVEVLNNALFHPLENNIVKSTASNYNINHTPIADLIQNVWSRIPLKDKRVMVSSQMDSSLYYLLKSPVGWLSANGHNGNQVWVCNTALTNAWSCWDVQGSTLRKLEIDGLLYMGIASGPSIFVFDPEQDHDHVWDSSTSTWVEEGIPWEAVTNTQGANRAHDAWAWLQQVNTTFGNFTGECVYGIRGVDVYGRSLEFKKHYISPQLGSHDPLERYDQDDALLVRQVMKEWQFFWRSADKPKNRSYGSICSVQYRYSPATVNVGYEYGSVETFEYGSRAQQTMNGVPVPFADTRKP